MESSEERSQETIKRVRRGGKRFKGEEWKSNGVYEMGKWKGDQYRRKYGAGKGKKRQGDQPQMYRNVHFSYPSPYNSVFKWY